MFWLLPRLLGLGCGGLFVLHNGWSVSRVLLGFYFGGGKIGCGLLFTYCLLVVKLLG